MPNHGYSMGAKVRTKEHQPGDGARALFVEVPKAFVLWVKRGWWDWRLAWHAAWWALSSLLSQRSRDKGVIYQATQDLMPVGLRDCSYCRGLKCGHCSYQGLKVAQNQVEATMLRVAEMVNAAAEVAGGLKDTYKKNRV